MRRLINYIPLLIIGLLFFSCKKENIQSTLPAYITIDAFQLTTDYLTQGSNSANITDAWVYINDNLQGVYELPATFPVLKEGAVELKIYAGIKNNGIGATRARYTPYQPYVKTVTLEKQKTLKITPQVTYFSNIKFPWIEDFESAGTSITYHPASDTIVNKSAIDVFEGTSSGRVFLTSDMIFFEAISPSFTDLPTDGKPIFLEMNFKTNHPLKVGVYAGATQIALYGLNTTTTWKKIYFDLTETIATNPGASSINVFFGFAVETSNPEVYFDNIKLVHF